MLKIFFFFTPFHSKRTNISSLEACSKLIFDVSHLSVVDLCSPVLHDCVYVIHRITEWSGLEGTLGIIWSNPPARAGCSGSHPGRFLVSPEKPIPTTSLGSLFQCSVTLKVMKFFLMFRWNFQCSSLSPCPMSEKSLALWVHPIGAHGFVDVQFAQTISNSILLNQGKVFLSNSLFYWGFLIAGQPPGRP